MVSGFFTSPRDQDRMTSGDASRMEMLSNRASGGANRSRSVENRPRRSRAAASNASSRSGRASFSTGNPSGLLPLGADVQTQTLQLLHQHVEGLRGARLQGVLALDDGFVDPRPALHVIGLDGQQLLEGVAGAIGLEGPDFHLAEPLAAKLRLAAQRLLGDERVRPA